MARLIPREFVAFHQTFLDLQYVRPGVISCFKTKEEYAAVYNGSLIQDFSVDPTNALLHAKDVDAFYARMDETDKRFKQYGDLCIKNAGDVLKYVGTVATVRDMVAIADYLEPDSKEINYYGASYGTIIGATFVNSTSSARCKISSLNL